MTHDVIIIGAGVSGLSAALALLVRGHRVTLLERGTLGGESSWAGGGILAPLLPWNYRDPLLALALPSMAVYEGWLREIEATGGLEAEYWRCGMRVFGIEERDAAVAWCAARGLRAEAAHSAEANVLGLPDIAQVRNPRLVAALGAAIHALGGSIHAGCAVTGLTANGHTVTGLETSQEHFVAHRIVIATGAWAGVGFRSPNGQPIATVPHIRPIRGQMLLFKLEPGVLNTILYRNGLYLIPRRDGHVLVGSTLEDVGFDKSTDEETRRRLHAEAAELLPALADVQPIRHWAGLRPGSPDNIPVIDRHPDFDNVYVNVGHYRYGVTLAPASAELLADLMEDKTPGVDPAPYRWQAVMERRWSDGLPGA